MNTGSEAIIRYVEHENVLYQGGEKGFPMREKFVGGEWIPAGMSGLDAAIYGRPLMKTKRANTNLMLFRSNPVSNCIEIQHIINLSDSV